MWCLTKVVSDAMLAELKECFLEAYDDNQDGKIDIREVIQIYIKFDLRAPSLSKWLSSKCTIKLDCNHQPACFLIFWYDGFAFNQTILSYFQLAQLLPMEETFLLLFRFDNPLDSSVEFMKVGQWEVMRTCQFGRFHKSCKNFQKRGLYVCRCYDFLLSFA